MAVLVYNLSHNKEQVGRYMTEEKKFDEWIIIKEKLHKNARFPNIHEGEVWWRGVGENIGVEINGKSARFSRPVLIFKKLSRLVFLGIPLTSKTQHIGSWYVHFYFQGKEQVASLAQQRIFCTARLYNRIGQIDDQDMKSIKEGYVDLYCK